MNTRSCVWYMLLVAVHTGVRTQHYIRECLSIHIFKNVKLVECIKFFYTFFSLLGLFFCSFTCFEAKLSALSNKNWSGFNPFFSEYRAENSLQWVKKKNV